MPNFEDCFKLKGPNLSMKGKTTRWFNADNEHRAKLVSDDISYVFNECGYRSDALEIRKDINVMTVGCSRAFGLGVPVQNRYGTVFCQLLRNATGQTVADWNLSWPGTSCDYVWRTIAGFVPHLRPSIVLVGFPRLGRREFFDATGEIYAYLPAVVPDSLKKREAYSALQTLTSDYQDLVCFMKNFHLVRNVLQEHKVKWLYSVAELDFDVYLKAISSFDEVLRVECVKTLDNARDGEHPGVRSHEDHAAKIFSKFQKQYGIKLM